jgi:hypothetical protein
MRPDYGTTQLRDDSEELSRRFTLTDAMVIVAAIAVSLIPIRVGVSSSGRPWVLPPIHFSNLREVRDSFVRLDLITSPCLFCLSVALILLRLRQPRPSIQRIFRQPGMVACTAVLVRTGIFFLLVSTGFLGAWVWGVDPLRSYVGRRDLLLVNFWVTRLQESGDLVAMGWITLSLSGVWRSEPSWIDRAGRAIGIYWIVGHLLLNALVGTPF